MKEFLLQHLNNITDDEVSLAMAKAKLRRYKKNETIFSSGKRFVSLLFITKGLVRSYRIINGEDITYSFFAANEFAGDYASFLEDTVTNLSFVAAADTELLEWAKHDVYELYDTSASFERLGRLMAEKAYLQMTYRLKELQTDSLEERYKQLVSKHPELVLQVPQRHIASMLGVKPQSLSRIKAKLVKQIS